MILYPKLYLNKVTDITINILKKHNIKGLILDVDNTLLDLDKNILEGAEEWCKELQGQGVKFYVVSNSNKKEKVKMVASKLGIPYIFFAMKPLKKGLNEAKNGMNIPNENIAVVGDQIFTDVLGANRCKMTSILVKPIAEKDIFITVIKRPLEKYIIKQYEKTTNGGKK